MTLILWIFHALTALAGALVVGVLSYDDPMNNPFSIFLPIAILVWFSVHLVIGVVQFLIRRGDARRPHGNHNGRWPIALIAAVLLYLVHLSVIPGLLLALFTDFPQWSLGHLILLVERLFVATCLLSILLRWPISRYLAGAGMLVMAIIPVIVLVQSFPPVSRNAVDYSLGLAFGIILIGLGIYLMRSVRIREFLYRAPSAQRVQVKQ